MNIKNEGRQLYEIMYEKGPYLIYKLRRFHAANIALLRQKHLKKHSPAERFKGAVKHSMSHVFIHTIV